MTERQKRIAELEDHNAELAKEILLNETAIYEVEKEIATIEIDLLAEETIQGHIQFLRFLVDRIEDRNTSYKKIIYQNDLEINNLENGKE